MGASCCDCASAIPAPDPRYRRILWVALGVNLAMFAIEIVASILAHSVSLCADALDFLGDAANYALAIAVFGMALRWRAATALVKGGVMGAFALWVAASAIYNAMIGTVPAAATMGALVALALVANVTVATLLYRYRRGESQTISVWLCTRNDALVNIRRVAAMDLPESRWQYRAGNAARRSVEMEWPWPARNNPSRAASCSTT